MSLRVSVHVNVRVNVRVKVHVNVRAMNHRVSIHVMMVRFHEQHSPLI